jgi:hypothetical protein
VISIQTGGLAPAFYCADHRPSQLEQPVWTWSASFINVWVPPEPPRDYQPGGLALDPAERAMPLEMSF